MIQLQYLNHLLSTRDPSSLLINNIDETFFSDYPTEFAFIKNHVTTYGKIPDSITFASKFPDFDFIVVEESSSYLLDELYNDKNKRMLATTFNAMKDLIQKGKVKQATALFTQASEQISKATHIEAMDILHNSERYDKYIEKTQDFSKHYVKTGFDEIDQAIGGWDRFEELATFVARPGTAKTWLLIKSAMAAIEQNLVVGIYSGEMSADKVGYRADTLLGHISNKGLMRGDASIQNEYKRFLDKINSEDKHCYVITPVNLGHAATVTDLRAFIEKYNLDILFVDQHSLLEDERNARDPVTRASNISRDLKNLQVLKKIPIIAVSQQNRGVVEEDAVIDVSHIAQADRIGQDSTCVIFIEKKENVLTLHLAKSRDAISGSKLKYAIDLDRGIFEFIPNEADALGGQGCEDLRNDFEYMEYGADEF